MTGETGFYKITLPFEDNTFNELLNSIEFETLAKGRMGNHLVRVGERGIPIVRTTSQYSIPAHNFSPIHLNVTEKIRHEAQNIQLPQLDFNNALIEVYDRNYTKMKYHSDQNLDLDPDSFIALFSAYENPDSLTDAALRKLKIKNKTTLEESEILLEHHSVILFSLSTNTQFLHKIVPESTQKMKAEETNNRWLGITFRKSNTLIQFRDDVPVFPNGTPLKMANDEEKLEFFKLRGEENKGMHFSYPDMYYTLSGGDLLKPKEA